MKISITDIPHRHQRYETVGDWVRIGDTDVVLVSTMANKDYEFLVALHELVEMYLCNKRKISEKSVTAFDRKFEARRKKGNLDEPGDNKKAPYYREHQAATLVEGLVAAELGIDWRRYTKAVNSLYKHGK
jgi:hypothetical protein